VKATHSEDGMENGRKQAALQWAILANTISVNINNAVLTVGNLYYLIL
jgi:hypothetical protein